MGQFFSGMGHMILAAGAIGLTSVKGRVRRGAMIKNVYATESLADVSALIFTPHAAVLTGDAALVSMQTADGAVAPESAEGMRLARRAAALAGDFDTGLAKTAAPERDATDTYIKSILHRRFPGLDLGGARVIDRRTAKDGARFPMTLLEERVGKGTQYTAVLRGEPLALLAFCTHYQAKDGTRPMTAQVREAIAHRAADELENDRTVIAVAEKRLAEPRLGRLSGVYDALTFCGLLVLEEELVPEAGTLAELCRRNGIKPILLLPDKGRDALALARRLGMADTAEEILANRRMSDADYLEHAVFAGLTPSQTIDLLRAYRRAGHKVAYIGEQLIDGAMIAEADAGFLTAVMPRRQRLDILTVDTLASDCPQQVKMAADVLLEKPSATGGGLLDALSAVCSARSIYRNVRGALFYLVTSQTARLLAMLVTAFRGGGLMSAVQILMLGLLFDFGAVLMMAFERPSVVAWSEDDAKRPLFEKGDRTSLLPFLAGGAWALLSAVVAVAAELFGFPLSPGAMFVSFILSSVVTAMYVLYGHCSERIRSERRTRALVLYLALTVIVSLAVLVAEAITATELGRFSPAFFALVSPALLAAFYAWLSRAFDKKTPQA